MNEAGPLRRPQVWGGVECTINRVGDTYCSQIDRSGHACRPDDLVRFAQLGIAAIRYPVLWERTAPASLDSPDWAWSDERLRLLRELGMTPILGLVHHGSGPRYTSLLDPDFSRKLAAYAAAVAARYPHVEYYTPVNEPLTTARFSGLYGVWYPHARDNTAFCTMLLNQCKGTALAMAAIRDINPNARLVQTEDLGKTHGTPPLLYQVTFNNELRWLTWDLLCGRVDHQHYLWKWLIEHCSARPADLLWFHEHACIPDMLGVNHYVTSERVLDHDVSRYPAELHGGNGRDRYVDLEAVRCVSAPVAGIGRLLDEAWQRYGLPIAITEAHIDATRDDQVRWLAEIWREARAALQRGADIRAVTAWALLGSYDWNSLVTQKLDYYEPGAFDLRGPVPRKTAVGHLIGELAAGHEPRHAILNGPGWWKRPGRFLPRPAHPENGDGRCSAAAARSSAPLLIAGASGTLGRAFARICTERGLDHCLVSRHEMDIADAASVHDALALRRPWAVINAAGYVRVDDAELEQERCFRENTIGACVLAEVCQDHRLPLVTFSSDLVFDGSQCVPYTESDRPRPLNTYGRSKCAAEKGVLARHPGALVVRTSSLFGPWDTVNHVTRALDALQAGMPVAAPGQYTITPTYIPDLVHACLDLLLDREAGVVHLTNGEPTTWGELVTRAAGLAQLDTTRLRVCGGEDLNYIALRPPYSALGSVRCRILPPLDDALNRFFCLYHPSGSYGRQ
jgi:dTDP-4-dehydrorhamnose reductase